MTKKLMVNPEDVRKPGVLELGSIPINSYGKTVAEEISSDSPITAEACMRMYRDMALIREFETMLDQIKKLGAYEGIPYKHAGPAHLSIGQEGAAVGEAFYLDVEDHIFGSHRSHGEIIAKGLSAIERIKGNGLLSIMEGYFGGAIVRTVESQGAKPENEEELGIDFLLYGLLAEIFGREIGFNKGMGGSMHAFFTPFGIFPNNAIVGGSGDISVGAALYKRCMNAPGIVVANIGDASMGCGPVWEGMQLAGMAQYRTLWEESHRGGLPIIFNFMNNFYGMGGQPIGETMGFDRLARSGAAINPENMHAECVDANNPLALAEAYARKKQILKDGKGPVLLEAICYRQTGHSPSDQSSYRERAEIDQWRDVDPLTEFAGKLIEAGVAGQEHIQEIHRYATAKVTKACSLAVSEDLSPRMKLGSHITLDTFMYSNEPLEELPGLAREDDVCLPLEENPRVQLIAKKARFGLDAAGKRLREGKAVSYRDAIFEAVVHHFYNDSRVVGYGEENRDWGGAFAVYRGLTESLPYRRLFNSPISEGAIVGSAVGFALEGGRPIVELMYCDFMGRAGDEVFNQLPKWQAMSGGYCRMPVVVRVSVGNKYGAQHSQDWTALCAHVPGLKVVFPATPYSAKGLMASALRGSDPVIYFESQRVYDMTEIFEAGGVPEAYYTLPIGKPAVIKEGSELTILTFGATLYTAWEAAQRFEKEFGISVELIDGRSLVPFDYEPLIESVKKTGLLILGSDACETGSYLHNVASKVSQIAFDALDGPPCVVSARNWIVPPAELEDDYYPQPEAFLDAYHTQLKPLSGYQPVTDRSPEEMIKLSKYGVL